MVLKTMPFNHEVENLHEALNVSSNQRERCRERVFFSSFANGLQGIELYEDAEEIPAEFHTKTGDLKLITDPLEYEYTLIMFMQLQPLAAETFHKWQAMNDSSVDKSTKSKLDLMMSIHDLVLKFKHADEQEEDSSASSNDNQVITPGSMMKRIELVRTSHYSWETYYNLVKSKNFFYSEDSNKPSKGSDFDIDDMLRGIFGKDDE